MNPWLPNSVIALRNYNLQLFISDLIAGLTVGLVALPLAMAFAISSGMSPQAGIYTGLIAGFLISALGGSMTQIGGPTGAFVVVIAGIVSKYGVNGLYTCTLIAGIILVALGVTGLGMAVKFIPRPVVVGFTNGIALLIASTQIKDFFGLTIAHMPGDFIGRMSSIKENWTTLSLPSTAVASGTVLLILLWPKISKRIPGTITALIGGTLIVYFTKMHVDTIGTRFGGIPQGLPKFVIPSIDWSHIPVLIAPAITVAMLGAIESLLSAVVSDRMSNDKHNPSVELIAQGVANIVSPLFGGLPATGAIARTATNIRSGAKTPVAGMIHALTLLGVLLFAAPLARYIPLCVLSGILMVVAYNMGEWREIPQLIKLPKSEAGVWFVTFMLTVFADLTVAVEAGMILAALLFIRRVTNTTTITRVTDEEVEDARVHILQDKEIPGFATVFRIHGPFLFGATEKLQEITDMIFELPPVVILRLRNMTAIDGTGSSSEAQTSASLKSMASWPGGEASVEGAYWRCLARPSCSLSHCISCLRSRISLARLRIIWLGSMLFFSSIIFMSYAYNYTLYCILNTTTV